MNLKLAWHTSSFGAMSNASLMVEIMEEVENLQNAIAEYCPEVISQSQYPSIKELGDDMNKLIEHRIELLSKFSTVTTESAEKD